MIAFSIHAHVTFVILWILLNGFPFCVSVLSCAVSFLRGLVAWIPIFAFGPLQVFMVGFHPVACLFSGTWLIGSFLLFVWARFMWASPPE